MLAVIIPTLNARRGLNKLLPELSGQVDRIIISDGGSTDDTLRAAVSQGAVLAVGTAGRGQQLRRGVSWSGSLDWILCLHADSRLPDDWLGAVTAHIKQYPDKAACFDLAYDSDKWAARIVEFLVFLRTRVLKFPYGDQGLLISKALYDEIGGYADIPLFEDVDMIRKLGRKRLRSLCVPITTSADKYERDGFFKRGWRNLKLLRRYLKGEDVNTLLQAYR